MKDSGGVVIYVGKAASLRSRLSQYFLHGLDAKTRSLMREIAEIDFIVTDNPKEALILESNMIKNYQPRYNINLKDDKHYSFLAITDEKFPRLIVTRKSSGKFKARAKKYFGPFVEGSKRAISARYLRKLFKVRICKKLPKNVCLQYHIGNCDAPCVNKISETEYGKNIEVLESVLSGKRAGKTLIAGLKKRMKQASDSLDYELAASIRDQISSLRIFFDRQRVEKQRSNDEDFIWFTIIAKTLFVQVLKSRKGVIGKAEKHSSEVMLQDDPVKSFALQYYSDIRPDRVYSNMDLSDLNVVYDIFRKPLAEKMKILQIARDSLNSSKLSPSVRKLKEELKLENPPIVIETFDISTLFGEDSVASMVQFVNGKPNKSSYRKFLIRDIDGQDDFAMMKQAVSRRYSRILKEKQPFPDLILIDGGAGQLHSALESLFELGLQIPVISLAKKEEEIYLPTMMKPLRLERSNPALKLLQNCRDEAHRFAVSYHRKRRKITRKEE